MATDVILNSNQGYYDISFNSDGDIHHEQSFETAILISIFEEKRASPSEVPQPNARRGWVGNETNDNFEQGSKFWLYEQERITGSMLAELGTTIRNGLQWMIDEGYAKDVLVSTPFLQKGVVRVSIDFVRLDSNIETFLFDLWSLTDFRD